MARLSGLASEPRRKKGRTNAASTDMSSQSQGIKRAASPAAEPSQPRRKRTHVPDDHDQLNQELEDSVSRSQSQATDNIVVASESSTRRSRRHSEPVGARDDEDDSQMTPPATQPASGQTAARRPGRPSNAARRARMSMPPLIDVEAAEQVGENEVQFAPLSAKLDGRARRRLRRSHISEEVNTIEEHQREDRKIREKYVELQRKVQEKDNVIKELEYKLEAHRMGTIQMEESRAQELEAELDQAKVAIDELRKSDTYTGGPREPSAFESNFDGADEDDDFQGFDDEPMATQEVLVEDSLSLPNGEYASRALALSSQVSVQSLTTITQTSHDVLAGASQESLPDKISEQAVQRYDGEIDRLIRQIGEKTGALRVMAIELQNLNVVPAGASSDAIIAELRRSFESAREQVENLMPNYTVGLTNSEFLHKLPEWLEGNIAELRQKVIVAEKYYQKSRMLQTQYESVLNLLSRSDTYNSALEEQNDFLEAGNAEKAQIIAELEERVAALNENADAQDVLVKDQTIEIHGLKDQAADQDLQIDRLRESIESYRTEVGNLTSTVTQLEEEHRATILSMEQAHDDAIQVLESKLEEEIAGREVAEEDAIQKADYIEELEARIAGIKQDFNVMNEQLTQLTQRLEEEKALREDVDAQLAEQTDLTYDRANVIENLKEEIDDLKAQRDTLRENLESERAQRAVTEAALDEANQQISELESSIHSTGIQANELRSKLFEVQQQKDQIIADLEADAAERDAEQQALLATEIAVREAEEEKVATLKAEVAQLDNSLATVEDDLTRMRLARDELEKDRDERVAILSGQEADLRQKYAALENSSQSTITTLQANITDLTNQINALIAENAEKDKTIIKLENSLEQSTVDNEKLQAANESLSQRVEKEAMDLLMIDDAHQTERAALKDVIDAQNLTIAGLENTATQRATEHATLLAEKTLELEQMHMVGEARLEAVAALTAQIEELKTAFAVAEEDNRKIIDQLTESQRVLQAKNEQLAEDLKKRNADALKAVQEMKVQGVKVHTNGVDLHKVASGKITKVSEKVKVGKRTGKSGKSKKRQWDSGFGVDENVENEDDTEAGVEEGVYA
jgi:chromosome segregation ATPase